MKIGGASLDEDRARIEAVLAEVGDEAQLAVDANGRFDLDDRDRLRARCSRDYPLFWYEEAGDPLDYALQAALAEHYPGPMATGENLFIAPGRAQPAPLRRHAPRPRLAAVRLRAVLRARASTCAPSSVLARAGWSPRRCIPHGGHQMSLDIAAGLGLGGNESYPDVFQPFGGFADGVRVEDGPRRPARPPGDRLRGQGRPDRRHARRSPSNREETPHSGSVVPGQSSDSDPGSFPPGVFA